MKIYAVKTLWRNDDDYGSYVSLYKTLDKAKKKLEQEIQEIIVNYETSRDSIEESDLWAEYDGVIDDKDFIYVFVDITLEEVK